MHVYVNYWWAFSAMLIFFFNYLKFVLSFVQLFFVMISFSLYKKLMWCSFLFTFTSTPTILLGFFSIFFNKTFSYFFFVCKSMYFVDDIIFFDTGYMSTFLLKFPCFKQCIHQQVRQTWIKSARHLWLYITLGLQWSLMTSTHLTLIGHMSM